MDQVKTPIVSENRVGVSPHWGLSICVAVLFFPVGLVAVLFSWLCSEAITAGSESDARRYSIYARNCAIGAAILVGIGILLFGLLAGTLLSALDMASKITVHTN